MALQYIVSLGALPMFGSIVTMLPDAPWFVTPYFSHNPARIGAQQSIEWHRKRFRDNELLVGQEFHQIMKTGLLTLAVGAGYTEAVFALQEAHSTGASLTFALTVNRFPDSVAAKIPQTRALMQIMGLMTTTQIAGLFVRNAKIASLIPYEGWRYGPLYAANFRGGRYADFYTTEE